MKLLQIPIKIPIKVRLKFNRKNLQSKRKTSVAVKRFLISLFGSHNHVKRLMMLHVNSFLKRITAHGSTSLYLKLVRFQGKTGSMQPSSLYWEQLYQRLYILTNLHCKSIDWFLYEGNNGIYWVKCFKIYNKTRANQVQTIFFKKNFFIIKSYFHGLKS